MVASYPQAAAQHVLHTHGSCIKILDLLTNRYYVGIVRGTSAEGLEIEMPLSARLSAGQHIRFALDDASGVILRRTMRRGTIRQVRSTDDARVRIDLRTAESLAA